MGGFSAGAAESVAGVCGKSEAGAGTGAGDALAGVLGVSAAWADDEPTAPRESAAATRSPTIVPRRLWVTQSVDIEFL